MESGEMVFFNNFVVLHNRTGFSNGPPPTLPRLMLRLWPKAYKPRPVAHNVSALGAHNGVNPVEGARSYYDGDLTYLDTDRESEYLATLDATDHNIQK